ncbi:hypothetical protein ABZU25_29720 [Micromonospora sp. NPDC005215]|uniref:hypothetical protein n=1 Tax=Micromonospora sp. NPDC005215 TaxID=3157024 RepID=UPI0033B7C533
MFDQSANFGFLKEHPLLVWHGAGAELFVYLDAQVAMFKIRAFGDEMAKNLEAALREFAAIADALSSRAAQPTDT